MAGSGRTQLASLGGALAGLALIARNALGTSLSAQAQTLVTILIVLGGLALVAGARERLGSFWGTVAAGGWIMTATIALVRFSLGVVAAAPAAAPVAPVFEALNLVLLVMVWVCALAYTAAFAMGGRSTFPSWFIALSWVTAAASLVGIWTLNSATGFLSYTGDFRTWMLYLIGVWLLAGGLAMRGATD